MNICDQINEELNITEELSGARHMDFAHTQFYDKLVADGFTDEEIAFLGIFSSFYSAGGLYQMNIEDELITKNEKMIKGLVAKKLIWMKAVAGYNGRIYKLDTTHDILRGESPNWMRLSDKTNGKKLKPAVKQMLKNVDRGRDK